MKRRKKKPKSNCHLETVELNEKRLKDFERENERRKILQVQSTFPSVLQTGSTRNFNAIRVSVGVSTSSLDFPWKCQDPHRQATQVNQTVLKRKPWEKEKTVPSNRSWRSWRDSLPSSKEISSTPNWDHSEGNNSNPCCEAGVDLIVQEELELLCLLKSNCLTNNKFSRGSLTKSTVIEMSRWIKQNGRHSVKVWESFGSRTRPFETFVTVSSCSSEAVTLIGTRKSLRTSGLYAWD